MNDFEKQSWNHLPDNLKQLVLKASSPTHTNHLQVHETTHTSSPPPSDPGPDSMVPIPHEDDGPTLLNFSAKQTPHPGDILKMMSSSHNSTKATNPDFKVNMQHVYHVSYHSTKHPASLVGHGANGGIAGQDMQVIYKDAHHMANIRGIDNHEITSIPLVTAGDVATLQHDLVIVIMNQYVYHPNHKTIHSCGQLEWFHNDVNDKSIKVPGGLQCILTNDGYIFPL